MFRKFRSPEANIAIPFLLIGLAVGGSVAYQLTTRNVANLYDQINPIRFSDAAYPLINPLLAYDIPDADAFQFNTSLEKNLRATIQKATDANEATTVSVYYRDLPRGGWVGINENTPYNPASLMKVAIVIAYYRQAETNPTILQHPLVYTKKMSDALRVIPFQTPSNLLVGHTYTVEELIRYLLVNSDNGAKNALLSELDQRTIADVYSDLGIENPDAAAGNYTISAKAYSMFFRVLYNATYLSRAMSEKLLDLLVEAQYKDGLVASVPSGVKAAQKYGEYVAVDAGGNPIGYELHDCGIIYKPASPYLLCVMTRGKQLDTLTSVIQHISKLVYAQTAQ